MMDLTAQELRDIAAAVDNANDNLWSCSSHGTMMLHTGNVEVWHVEETALIGKLVRGHDDIFAFRLNQAKAQTVEVTDALIEKCAKALYDAHREATGYEPFEWHELSGLGKKKFVEQATTVLRCLEHEA